MSRYTFFFKFPFLGFSSEGELPSETGQQRTYKNNPKLYLQNNPKQPPYTKHRSATQTEV